MGFDWTMAATCISAMAAVVALFLSGQQIRLSNKQSLFDRRVAVWLTTLGLLELYKGNECHLKKKDEPQLALDFVFVWLTNNTFLCEISPVATHPLEAEYRQRFLIKIEELKHLALEAGYIFKGTPSNSISSFIADYQNLLLAIYRYQVLMHEVKKNADRFCWTLERSCKEVDEFGYRKELYAAYDAIACSYGNLINEKMRRKVENQIRLVR